jgi:hypothetical protein
MQTDIHELSYIRDSDCRVGTEEYSHALYRVTIDWSYTFIWE